MIHRRPVVISNEIRLKRSQHKGTFLVVEGRDDRLFCELFTDATVCKIVVAEGKESVYEVIKILDDVSFPGVLGIVDADFDRLENRGAVSANIVLPQAHDLETMLIQSPALERVLVEFGSQEKIEVLGRDVRDILVSAALPVGYLRLHSQRCGLNLRFDGLNYSACVDTQSVTTDRLRLIQEVKNRSQRPELDSAELEAAIQRLEGSAYEPWQVCSGDDLIGVLSIGLRRAFGTNSAGVVGSEELRRALRLAYSENEFVTSDLANSLRAWEAKNAPFRVLR